VNRHERRRQAATRTKAAGKAARENNERRMAERHATLVELRGDLLERFIRWVKERPEEAAALATKYEEP